MLMLTPLAVWKHQTKFLGRSGNLSARLQAPNEDRNRTLANNQSTLQGVAVIGQIVVQQQIVSQFNTRAGGL